MNELSGVGKAGFSSLPQSIRRRIKQSPLIVDAQRKYLQSRAPGISNQRYWDKIGEAFETGKLNDRSLDPHVHAFLNDIADPAKSVVEFGCGIGRTAEVLSSKNFRNYLGVDIAPDLIDKARERLPGLEFRIGNITGFKLARKFDAAIATDVLLYLSPEDQIKALLNLNKALKTGARVLLRWAPGQNEILLKAKPIENGKVEGWVFLASKEYIEQILAITGFALTRPIQTEALTINAGTPYERIQDYHVIFGVKA